MKTTTIFFTASALMLLLSLSACAQSNKNNTDSDKTISRDYNVSAFHAIESEIVGNIIFTQSETTKVSAEGEEKWVNNLVVKVENGTLKLDKKKDIKNTLFGGRKTQRLTVYVSAPDISHLDLDGVGNMRFEGNVHLESLSIDSDGVGNFHAEQLTCGRLKVESDGVGNITLKGKGQFAEYLSDGVGNIDATKFEAEDAIVRSSGVGNVKCYASKSIELYGNGVGNITYYGNPEVKSLSKNGIGKVKSGN